MNDSIPQGAWAASILVLLYSAVCLSASMLLICMLWRNGDRTSYVTMLAFLVTGSTIASMAQQIVFATTWHRIKVVALEQAVASKHDPWIGTTPLSRGANLALYEVQLYCYTVNSMIILCWAVALGRGVFQLPLIWARGREKQICLASKIVSLLVPALIVALTHVRAVTNHYLGALVMSNIVMLGSLILGSVCMIAIMIKYVAHRRLFASIQGGSSSNRGAHSSSGRGTLPSTKAKIRVDKVLLLRFAIAFAILSAFEVTFIMFTYTRSGAATALRERNSPDFSVSTAVNEILLFLPGVTQSLLAFALFGTTAQFRKEYREWFQATFREKRRPSLEEQAVSRTGRANSWQVLETPGAGGEYRAAVKGSRWQTPTQSMELSDVSGLGTKTTTTNVTVQDRGLEEVYSGRSTESVHQPWRTLGIPPR